MWLIDVNTLELKEFFDSAVPRYAILSHVWGSEEIAFHEMGQTHELYQHKAGFQKIVNCCAVAKGSGIKYAWIDTCCVDKRNSADLSEAINSMYRYYRDAEVCLIYLIDVPGQQAGGVRISRAKQLDEIKSSRWLTRGWTLQELIAPGRRNFFAKDWSLIPLVAEGKDLIHLISRVTKVPLNLLIHKDPVASYCIAERMSWASKRQTTRSEDIAYSLMGLFDVNIPIIYGEGQRNAFRRLQKEIIQNSFDQTIFAWKGEYATSGLIANAPSDFAETPPLRLWAPFRLEPYSFTNLGLSINMNITSEKTTRILGFGKHEEDPCFWAALQCHVLVEHEWKSLMVRLKLIKGVQAFVNNQRCKVYRRIDCAEWNVTHRIAEGRNEQTIILEDEHHSLLLHSEQDNQIRWISEMAPQPGMMFTI